MLKRHAAFLLLPVFALGCSSDYRANPAAPSAGGTTARPTASLIADQTTVTFDGFDPSTLVLSIKTTTVSDQVLSVIDAGKIHLQILVDENGAPVPCGSAGTWVRFDQVGGGIGVSGAMTTHDVDLGDLSSRAEGLQNASCGDQVCIRAQYVTGGGNPKVETHFSDPTAFDVICAGCTLTQGYWKSHGPTPTGNNENEWPVVSLLLGTVNYSDAQLLSILNTAPAGNGLITLAHQLIAAKLNVANGADDSAIAADILDADALIGALVVPPVGGGALAPAAVSALVTALTNYNEGVTGPGHCVDTN